MAKDRTVNVRIPLKETSTSTSVDKFDDYTDAGALRHIWYLSLIVSMGTVAGLFTYANILNWHGGVPLGYDSYYYLGWINMVVSSGPLQFASSQHYVEFLYPIVASIPVYLGVSADATEIVLPAVLACVMVVATGVLAMETRDRRFAILSVAFSSGWFAVYRMGADYHANLFALPLLLLATALLIRVTRKGKASATVFGVFLTLVVLAGAAHIETTDFFMATWILAFLLLGRETGSDSWRRLLFMIGAGALATSLFTFSYFQGLSGSLSSQYCVFPPYWLEVFGPGAGLAVLGLGVAAKRYRLLTIEGLFAKLLLSWSAMAIAIGLLGYVTQFPIILSDRSLLLLPLPLVSSLGTLWVADHFRSFHDFSQTRWMALSAIAIPLLIAPAVFSYVAPHFTYFAQHSPTLVSCSH